MEKSGGRKSRATVPLSSALGEVVWKLCGSSVLVRIKEKPTRIGFKYRLSCVLSPDSTRPTDVNT
jgi:hypothetical protein